MENALDAGAEDLKSEDEYFEVLAPCLSLTASTGARPGGYRSRQPNSPICPKLHTDLQSG